MKILFTHRYFWPDSPPYGLMIKSLAEALATEIDNNVHVYASMPSYRTKVVDKNLRVQKVNGVNITRGWVIGSESSGVLIRVLNVIAYCLGMFIHILKIKPDVVTASTFPPVFAACISSIAANLVGAKFIYHMQDIHPEVALHSKGFLGKRVPQLLLRWVDNRTLRRTNAVIVLSKDMENTLRSRGIEIPPIYVINNPAIETDEISSAVPTEYVKAQGSVRVIFAGNLGRFQNLPVLLDGIAVCFDKYPNLELLFLGDGGEKAKLIERWGDHPQVKFIAAMPFHQAKELISSSDIGLVSLQENIYRVSFPSKFATYLNFGLPVLALVESQSEMACTIKDNCLGAVPADMSAEQIAVSLKSLLGRNTKKSQIKNWYEQNLSPKINHDTWRRLLSEQVVFRKI